MVSAVQGAATVLAELSSARTPWLALAPVGRGLLAAAPRDVTVIDITDPRAVPVTVNPFEPAPGYPVQAHVGRLAGLFEAAFGLSDPVAGTLRAGLRRAYADGGWDMLTGAARPGAVSPPAVPAFRQLKLATVDTARDLGYGPSMQAGIRGFLETRLDALWAGPAGHFLEGGHPAALARLLRGHPLAMESERNRTAATTALLGDGRTDLDADLAIAGMGINPPRRLRHAARAMGAAGHGGQPGWLEVVLSWPHRLIGAAAPDPGRGPDRDRIASGPR